MKKFILCILLVFSTLILTAFPTYAEETNLDTIQTPDGYSVTQFADGSTLTVSPAYTKHDESIMRATTQSVSAHRDATYKDSSGNVEWKYTLTATFSYVSGVSATCTNASYTQTISGSGWSFSNGSATKSGNVATGKGTFKHKVLFITTTTHNVNITLTCDKYGNVT